MDAAAPVVLRLRSYPFQDEQRTLDQSPESFIVQAGQAVSFLLGNFEQLIELLLSPGLVGFCWQDQSATGIAAAVNENVHTHFTVRGGLLTIVNRGTASAGGRLRTLKVTEPLHMTVPGLSIDPGSGFEMVEAQKGSVRFYVDPQSIGQLVCIAGDSYSSELKASDGHIYYSHRWNLQRPYSIYDAREGIIDIRYEEGYLRVWTATNMDMDAEFLLPRFDIATEELAYPRENPRADLRADPVTELQGVLESRPQLWSISLAEPRLVSITTTVPGMTALFVDEECRAIAASGRPTSRRILQFLKPGTYRIFNRPFAGTPVSGKISVKTISPIDYEAIDKELSLIHI